MKKIAFSGTLDPITNGHMWVIQEARAIAEEVVVFISQNPQKKPQFTAERRKEIIEQSIAEQGWTNVNVTIVKGDYTARVAKRQGIDYLIRGIRNTVDFDYENLIQQTNVDILQGSKTLFAMPPRDLGSVSSSFIRALQGPVGWHWSVKKFLPAPAYKAWILDWLRKEWDSLWPDSPTQSSKWFDRIVGDTCYGSPLRHYHNPDHLVHGLSEITVWAANIKAAQRDVVTLKKAFWFHDAVYQVSPHTQVSNEEESARMWLEAHLESELDSADQDGPENLIRATDHLQMNTISHPLKNIMLCVDLAILGQSEHVYDDYARAIRAEYAMVDEETYKTNRRRILTLFLNQAQSGELFRDDYFSELYEQRAIENINREIADLDSNGISSFADSNNKKYQ